MSSRAQRSLSPTLCRCPTFVENALGGERVVLSVIGPHAGEDEHAIFSRKIDDISRAGRTLWLCQSPAARPDHAQSFLKEPAYAVFLAPARPRGARPTTSAHRMTEVSANRHTWSPIFDDIGPVTGKATSGAYALVISELVLCEETIELWSYIDPSGDAVRFRLGASTLLAEERGATVPLTRPKLQTRRVLAVAKLAVPFSIWVR